MTKILDASCVGGVVTCESLPVPGVTILSEGVASSSGILVLDGDSKIYIAKISPDLKTTLGKIADSLGQIVIGMTLLDAKPIGILPPAPAAAASIAQLTAIQAQVTALKELLK